MSVIDDSWTYRKEITIENHQEFDSNIRNLFSNVLNMSSFKVKNYDDNGQNYDYELKMLIEENKTLRQEIALKEEKQDKQKAKYECCKKDQKLLSQEIKDTHEAFLMAKKFYKKFLKVYYTIESRNGDKQVIFVQFFTDAKKENEKYSMRVIRHLKNESYELLETNPKLNIFDELKATLHQSNDILSVLCSIRQAFVHMRKSKK